MRDRMDGIGVPKSLLFDCSERSVRMRANYCH